MRTGALVSLSANGLSTTGLYPSIVAAGSYQGQTYGIAPGVNDLALYYNKDQFTAAGLTPPTTWADLVRRAIAAEYRGLPPCPRRPLALRAAPPGARPSADPGDLIELLTIPVRSGLILTRARLAEGAGRAGVGFRIGERRFALRAMLEQDPGATLAWLAGEAGRWQQRHRHRAPGDQVTGWWAARAARTGQVLRDYAGPGRKG